MADKNLSIGISADTKDAQSGIEGLQKKTGLLSKAMNLLVVDVVNLAKTGFSFLKETIKASIGAALEQEAAIGKLSAGLQKHGNLTDENLKSQIKWAEAMSLNVLAQDDAIISAQGLLAQFGLEGEALKKATEAALDLSSATGTDLSSAAMLMAKASQGSTAALSKMGIVIDENIPTAQKFEAALAGVQGKFGGAAQAEAKTFSGQLSNMKKAFGEIAEDIGTALLPVISDLVPFIKSLGEELKKAVDSDWFKTSITTIRILMVTLGSAVKIIALEFELMADIFMESFLRMKLGFEDISYGAKLSWLKIKGIVKDTSAEINILNEEHSLKEKKLQDDVTAHKVDAWSKIKNVGKEELEKVKQIIKDANKEIKLDSKKSFVDDDDSVSKSVEKSIKNIGETVKETKTGLEDISDKAKGVFDAAVIFDKGKFDLSANAFGNAIKKRLVSDLTAHTAAESAKALISNWWNFGVLAIPQIAFNSVQLATGIAAVNAIQFQSGGIVPGTSTSGDKVIARMNSGEMVLNKSQQSNLFGMLQNGTSGGMTININGGIFMSDRNQAKQLAKMIDEELVTLGRQGQRLS